MSSNISHSIDDAIDFLDHIQNAVQDRPDRKRWLKFISEIKDAVLRDNCDLLCQLGEVTSSHKPDWLRPLIAGYCLCCIGEGDKGFPLLLRSYEFDKTSLTLQRVYEHGMLLNKFSDMQFFANEDLSSKAPLMPRESRLIRAWNYKEKGQLF